MLVSHLFKTQRKWENKKIIKKDIFDNCWNSDMLLKILHFFFLPFFFLINENVKGMQ